MYETSYLFCDEKEKSFINVVCSYFKFKLSANQRHNLKPKSAKFMSASFLVDCLLKNVTHYENMPIQNILKILPQKNVNFQRKNSDIFHFSAQNIDVGVVMGLEGWGVGRGGGGGGCGLEDIYSFTPGYLPTQTFTHLDTRDKFETNIMFSEMPFRISIRGNVI